ncbi:MAG: type I restriction-modification system subunit M N-terminal domain-containing protein [Paludibacteraceae bacterium]
MEQAQYSRLFSFLWNIANDVLVHAFEKGKYKDIIMPMLVLRRIDVLLEPTKDKVLERKEANDAALRKAFATLGFTLETKVK